MGHSVFFKVYTASEAFWEDVYDEGANDKYPSDEHSLTMMNCEIHADRTILPYLQKEKPHKENDQSRTPPFGFMPRLVLS